MTNIEVTITQPVIEVRFESTLQTSGGSSNWGDIGGTLSNQTDLQQALDAKLPTGTTTSNISEGSNLYFTNARAIAALAATLASYVTTTALNTALSAYVTAVSLASTLANYLQKNAPITGATKTKITYDANGLVTSGTDATTADINDSSNRRYVTDAQLTVIGNTSGTNTGDNAVNTTSNSYADGKVADAINDGVTTIAPSQNAVFDALTGKQNSLGFTPENVANKATTFTTINNTLYPSVQAVENRILQSSKNLYITVGDQINSTNTPANIVGLSFVIEPNKRYSIHGRISIGCNNTGGVQLALVVPGTSTLILAYTGLTNLTTAFVTNRSLTNGALSTAMNTQNRTQNPIDIYVEVTSDATGGTCSFQFQPAVNTQTATIYQLNTYLTLVELP